MTKNEIECFLAICHHKTVSGAAQALYITQSSLSVRLKILENEIGGALFFRKKGSREMTLTPVGKEFYELALQYEEILDKMQQVYKKQSKTLRVSALNSLGTYFLPEVYEYFLQKSQEYKLEIQDMELEGAQNSICSGLTDLAFTVGKTTNPKLLQTPVFCEPMALICGEKISFDVPATADMLCTYKEAYVEWSHDFAHWHREIFLGAKPQITVSIMAQLEQFMEKGDFWAIVPISVAEGLSRTCKIHKADTGFQLPFREVSILTSADYENEAVRYFLGCLNTVIKSHTYIKSLI